MVHAQLAPLRVLLVDDSSVYRATVRRILSTAAGIEVVGEAEDGRDSLTQASLLKPDVVLMDCSMPEMDGPEAARLLRRMNPLIRIIALSVGDDEDCMKRMAEAGVDEILVKAGSPDEIARAIAGADQLVSLELTKWSVSMAKWSEMELIRS